MLVSDLIVSESADWNVEKIKLYLPQYEDLIMKLVPSACDMSDNLVWLPENSGNYTTKTGYALAKINVAENRDAFNWHQCVWNVKMLTIDK